MRYSYLIMILPLMFFSCEEETPVPKPPTYLRLELPGHDYKPVMDSCPVHFELSELYTFRTIEAKENMYQGEIKLGPLNGSIYLHYWDMTEPLAYYINNANDEIDRHKVKASKIADEQHLRPADRVFGTFFELQGDVATPFQFYLTDSVSRFAYAEVLFNSTPNYDSLKPSLDYLRVDLDHMIESFKWKE